MKLLVHIGQYLINWLNLLDHAANCLLLGDSDETISARAARARNAGLKEACIFCNFLTWAQKVVTFGKMTRDHCSYALDKSAETNSREIWSWGAGKINDTPINVADSTSKTDK